MGPVNRGAHEFLPPMRRRISRWRKPGIFPLRIPGQREHVQDKIALETLRFIVPGRIASKRQPKISASVICRAKPSFPDGVFPIPD